MAHLPDARSRRIAAEKESEAIKHVFATERERIAKENAVNIGSSKFVGQVESVEDTLKRQTTGLVNLEDFKRAHAAVHEQQIREAARTSELAAEARKRKKKNAKIKAKLSFAEDQEDDDVESEKIVKVVKKPKLGKDPGIDTSFLPDREREDEERRMREELRKEWLAKQEAMKKETIEIVCSYWDGTGHRMSVECVKGDTISDFLEKCRLQTPELRNVSVDNLLYVKEDLIIPQHYSFYDFIVNKARGKSGPLFSFDVHDDIRLKSDATVEKDESHAGKVMTRAYYERNKHIFPLNRFEAYDPDKNYGNYSIKDTLRK